MLIPIYIKFSFSRKLIRKIKGDIISSVLADVVLVNIGITIEQVLANFFYRFLINTLSDCEPKMTRPFRVIAIDHEVQFALF